MLLAFWKYGSIRQKNSKITRERRLDIFIFNLQQASDDFTVATHKESLDKLKDFGFNVCPRYILCDDI